MDQFNIDFINKLGNSIKKNSIDFEFGLIQTSFYQSGCQFDKFLIKENFKFRNIIN